MRGNLIIPDRVESIGDYAFAQCSGLDGELKLSTSLKTIPESCFNSCENLKGDLIVPDSIEEIGAHAFWNCGFDGKLVLSKSLKKMGIYAFSSCRKLMGSLVIPELMETIPSYAFAYCTDLESVTFPGALKYISEGAFGDCTALKNIGLPEHLLIIGNDAFRHCISLEGDLNLPDSLLSVGEHSFENCKKIKHIKLPESLLNIKEDAFVDCEALCGDLLIPDSVYVIGSNAFQKTKISSVQFGNQNAKLVSIGSGAFYQCDALKNVQFTGNIPDYYAETGIEEKDGYPETLYSSFPEDCKIDFVENQKNIENDLQLSINDKTHVNKIEPYSWMDHLRNSKLKGTGQYADIEIIFEDMMELRVNGRRKNNVEFEADPYDAEMKISITFPFRGGIVTDMRMIEGNGSDCVLEATFIKDGQESLMYFTDGSEEAIYF